MPGAHVWRQTPFLRLLIPLVAGIFLQWHLQLNATVITVTLVVSAFVLSLLHLLAITTQFVLNPLRGTCIQVIIISIGMLLVWVKDVRHDPRWFVHNYNDSDCIMVMINEPLIEKPKSYKAEGLVIKIINDDTLHATTGKVLLYFQKDSNLSLNYGDRVIIRKPLQRIKNSGNPGSFDFAEYSALHQTYHQAYLQKKDWIKVDTGQGNPFIQFIHSSREMVLKILRKNIVQDERSVAVAEALLIGYTRDLDKDLVQAYSNTGVVHIIAISGLHLGLIYVLLLAIFKRIPLLKRSGIAKIIIIAGCLWLFSFLTGGSASVLRSAVMFTFIIVGEKFGRKSTTLNSLIASAFLLLCYNPFFLWDVGFQLSYLALGGIILVQRPLSNLIYVKNKWLDKLWQLNAVTVSAQVFTFPICLYYFHQFPNYFLFTNILAVPLSGLILYAEIILISISWISTAAQVMGVLTGWLIGWMNSVIIWFNGLPLSVASNIDMSLLLTILLYLFLFLMLEWWLNKNRQALIWGLFSLLSCMIFMSYDKWIAINQQKIIVYNIAGQSGIDLVAGNNFNFLGRTDESAYNYNIRASRIKFNMKNGVDSVVKRSRNFYFFGGKKILIIDTAITFSSTIKPVIDLLIISKNPRINILDLSLVFDLKQIVFDGSNSLWKIDKWKKECERLHLRCHIIQEEGAYVSDL